MHDLDILVPSPDVHRAQRAVAALGYGPVAPTGGEQHENWMAAHHHHLPALVSEDGRLAVELHHHLVRPSDPGHFDLSGFWARGRPASAGPPHLVPAPEDLLLHVALHFPQPPLAHRRSAGPTRRHRLDRVLDVDWPALADNARSYGVGPSVFLALLAAEEAPGHRRPGPNSGCPVPGLVPCRVRAPVCRGEGAAPADLAAPRLPHPGFSAMKRAVADRAYLARRPGLPGPTLRLHRAPVVGKSLGPTAGRSGAPGRPVPGPAVGVRPRAVVDPVDPLPGAPAVNQRRRKSRCAAGPWARLRWSEPQHGRSNGQAAIRETGVATARAPAKADSVHLLGKGSGVRPGGRADRTAANGFPIPPRSLAWRVGCPRWARRPDRFYLKRGHDMRQAITTCARRSWPPYRPTGRSSAPGSSTSGVAPAGRHFAPEAAGAEFWGCDTHEPSIRWVQQHLCPPLRAFHNGESPPLDQPDASFDLVWALSVFTHITDQWSAWLVEVHRVLAEGGLFLATFMGEGVSQSLASEPWVEDRVGMNVVSPGHGWDRGGPMVQHSPWWIRAHWGRGFDVVDLQPYGFSRVGREGQGSVLLRKRAVDVGADDFERPEPAEPREVVAARHNVAQLYAELAAVNASPGRRLHRFLGELRGRPVNLATEGAVPGRKRAAAADGRGWGGEDPEDDRG